MSNLKNIDIYVDTWREEPLQAMPSILKAGNVMAYRRDDFYHDVQSQPAYDDFCQSMRVDRMSETELIDRHLSQFWLTHKFAVRASGYSLLVKTRIDCYFEERDFLQSVINQHATRFSKSQKFISSQEHNSDQLDQWQSFFLPLNQLDYDRDQTPIAVCQTNVRLPNGKRGILNDTAIGFDYLYQQRFADTAWINKVLETYIELDQCSTAVPAGDLVWYELLKDGVGVEDPRFHATKIHPWTEIPNDI